MTFFWWRKKQTKHPAQWPHHEPKTLNGVPCWKLWFFRTPCHVWNCDFSERLALVEIAMFPNALPCLIEIVISLNATWNSQILNPDTLPWVELAALSIFVRLRISVLNAHHVSLKVFVDTSCKSICSTWSWLVMMLELRCAPTHGRGDQPTLLLVKISFIDSVNTQGLTQWVP